MIYLQPYHFISDYNKKEIQNLNKKIILIFRNYEVPTKEETLIKIKKECKKLGKKLFLSNDIKLAIKLKFDGVYIPAFNKSLNLNFTVNKKFKKIGSAHNFTEIKIKERQGVDVIFLSPLFKINKNSNFLDIKRFNLLSKFTKKKVVALGGINEKNINRIKLVNCDGYASITYLKKKKKLDDVRK
tara:strand:+ start:3355 stop:3909 length:555 start_codon:yes stop_codon:yes gene_type:complete